MLIKKPYKKKYDILFCGKCNKIAKNHPRYVNDRPALPSDLWELFNIRDMEIRRCPICGEGYGIYKEEI